MTTKAPTQLRIRVIQRGRELTRIPLELRELHRYCNFIARNPPTWVDATPRSGPVFDSVLYQIPLDWPMIYRAENELWFMDAFERLCEARARVNHDYDALCTVAMSKGWWSKNDETSEEESESGSSDSADVLDKGK